MQFYDFVGLIGIVLIIGSYLLLQAERISSADLAYSVVNAVGALCVLYSIYFAFNLSALIVEVFWFVISLFGVLRFILRDKKRRDSKG